MAATTVVGSSYDNNGWMKRTDACIVTAGVVADTMRGGSR